MSAAALMRGSLPPPVGRISLLPGRLDRAGFSPGPPQAVAAPGAGLGARPQGLSWMFGHTGPGPPCTQLSLHSLSSRARKAWGGGSGGVGENYATVSFVDKDTKLLGTWMLPSGTKVTGTTGGRASPPRSLPIVSQPRTRTRTTGPCTDTRVDAHACARTGFQAAISQ